MTGILGRLRISAEIADNLVAKSRQEQFDPAKPNVGLLPFGKYLKAYMGCSSTPRHPQSVRTVAMFPRAPNIMHWAAP